MSDGNIDELLTRLRSFDEGSDDFPGSYIRTVTLRNPDGPEAAAAIEALTQENADLIHDLERQMTIANIECNRAEDGLSTIQSLEADKAALLDRVKVLEEGLEEISGGQIQCADGSARDMTAFRMKLVARAAIEAMKGD